MQYTGLKLSGYMEQDEDVGHDTPSFYLNKAMSKIKIKNNKDVKQH